MGKVRVHELAKKLNLSNQEMINRLAARGMIVRTHSSSIDEAQAMQLLNMAPTADAGARPRTVLRKRREEIEPEVQAVEATEAPEPVLAQEQTVEEKIDPAQEPTLEVDVPAAVAPVSFTQKPAVAVISPTTGAPLINNVVRVIDAEAIRARLAAEGRTFRPRTPRLGVSSARPFGGVRDIKVVHDSFGMPPQMLDVTPGSAAAKHGKKKELAPVLSERERREQKSSGYELWLQPGKKKRSSKKGKAPVTIQAAAHKRVVELSGPITVNELAHRMSVKAGQLVTKLMGMGMMATVNQAIDPETAAIIAQEFEYEVKNVAFAETELLKDQADTVENLIARPPVVTIMGHVDHGKTSVLDALRHANVAAGEAGGITQHIGAYSVDTGHGKITFLDTPGHEAFTAMRARGARVTDVVVLVVAADDGVMPQTIEAINHAKAAKVPMVVAINKMDSHNAKPERVMQQLAEHGVVCEEWGGDVLTFKVSALKKTGLKELLDGLLMQAEILELKANPNTQASGWVIEARLDRGRGPVSTILLQKGTLKLGDCLIAGEFSGRVRAMHDSNGEKVVEAGPSMAVQVLGLDGVPVAGDRLNVVDDEKTAKEITGHRAQKMREQELMKTSRVTLENFLQSSPQDKEQVLKLIVKADVAGSVEALISSLKALRTKEVRVEVVHSGVGTITENDVNLAIASAAIIIGFNVRPDAKALALAAQEKVDVRHYSVIYEVLDQTRSAMAGLLAPVVTESYLGKAEVRVVFPVNKLGKIAGCYVLDGKIVRAAKVRVKRGNDVLFTGNIASLKRFKDDVKEVTVGYECGLGLDGFQGLEPGDTLECFEQKNVAAKLSEAIKVEPKETKPNGGMAASA